MGSLAMGMPFQVFPTGPAVKNNHQQQLSAPQTNGNNRKSPQAFEPPPMGCRPEIKIPANPMTLLKSAPRPQPKGDYWVQEYVQDKARDSIPSEEEIRQQFASSPIIQQHQSTPSSAHVQKQQSPLRFAQRSPSPPNQRDFSDQIRNLKLEDVRTSSPNQVNRSSPVMAHSPIPSSLPSPAMTAKQVMMEPIQAPKTPSPNYQQQLSYQQPAPQQTYQQPQAQAIYQPLPQASFTPLPQATYQQLPQQSYQPPQQNYQPQPALGGGRVILSTMPNRPQQEAQQHVSYFFCIIFEIYQHGHYSWAPFTSHHQ